MRRRWMMVAAVVLVAVAFGGVQATANDSTSFRAWLNGYQEVPTLSLEARGNFSAELSDGGTSLEFTLRYSNLTGDAAAAHIHLGRRAVNGGVIAWLCGGGGQQACPTGTSATISGTIEAAHVEGPAEQGIEAGEFDELLAAMRVGATYVNVHTAAYPTGEIRGQIR